ncbi:MAG: DUF1588 domain-containing protein, partial [Pseudomonadota bacterium]
PDADLYTAADSGALATPNGIAEQVTRLLAVTSGAGHREPFLANFPGQWLQLSAAAAAAPSPTLFPKFDEPLRQALGDESRLFFASTINEGRTALDLVRTDFSFLNERLASHYGISGVTGADMRKVNTAGTARGGILTQASVLTVTSNPTRTSPVQRGKWILDNILNQPPPAPPDNVPALDDTHRQLTGTMRQKLAQHRTNPTCAACHQAMDPLGLALENYDPIGGWRAKDGNESIDVSATMPDGTAFQGASGLKGILRARAADFRRCLVEKMLIYALGRGLDYRDVRIVDRISDEVAQGQDRFSSLIVALASSDLFLAPAGASARALVSANASADDSRLHPPPAVSARGGSAPSVTAN